MSFEDMMAAGVPLNDIMNLMGIYADDSGSSMLDMFGNIEDGEAALTMAGENSNKYTDALAAMSTQTDVVGEAYDKVSDTSAEKFSKAMNEINNVAISLYTDAFQPLIGGLYDIANWFADNSEITTLMAIGIGTLTALVIAYNIQQALLASGMTLWGVIAGVGTTITTALGVAFEFLLGPIGLAILAIGILIAIIYELVTNWDVVSAYLSVAIQIFAEMIATAFQGIGTFFNGFFDGIVNGFSYAFNGIMGIINGVVGFITGQIDCIKDAFNNIIDFIGNVFTGNWEGAWRNIINIFGDIVSGIGNMFKVPINCVVDILNGFINGINRIEIPNWVPIVGGKGINIPTIPRLKIGMDYVPNDYFPAFLDKGEAVLTADQAAIYRRLGGNLQGLLSSPSSSGSDSTSIYQSLPLSKVDMKTAFKEAIKESNFGDTVLQLGYEEVARASNKGNLIIDTRYNK